MQLIHKISFAFSLILIGTQVNAQFEGFTSFKNDSAIIRKVKKAGIKSAMELTRRNGAAVQVKTYVFNTLGKVSEIYEKAEQGKMHTHYNYDEKGELVQEVLYGLADTTQIVSTENYEYNDKGILLKKEKQLLIDAKLSSESLIATQVLVCNGTKTVTESEEFFRGNKTASFKETDSIAGKSKYTIAYKFRENDIDEKGRVHGKKTLVRNYSDGTTEFEDNIEYEIYGAVESSKDITTKYYVRDAKNKLIEHGSIDYEAAYAEFLQRHPDNFNPYQISGLFVEAVLRNEIKGNKRPDAKFTYSPKGQLIEKTWYGNKYKYSYDAKGNITSFVVVSESIDTGKINNTLIYNDKGLVTKLISEVLPSADSKAQKEITETTYSYNY